MKNKIRSSDRQWSENLWSRIRNLITGLNDRLTTQEEAGYITTETDPTVPAWAKASTKPTYTADEVGAIPTTQKGSASGVAELDSGGKVPSSQLPSYVDDVLEYSSRNSFPSTGEAGKIYVATDTNLTYRWTGSGYVEIAGGLALGETSSTAYRGDRGKAAYDHAQANGSAFVSGLYLIQTNAEGHVIGAVAVQKSDITALGIPAQDTTYTFSDGDPTLAWGTRSKVGTTGGTDLHVTMPAMPSAQDVGALPDSTTIPTKTSQLQNDSGFLTQHQDISGKKDTQSPVADPAASGNAISFIATISQDAQGVITPTKKTVPSASTTAAGLMSAEDKTKLNGLDMLGFYIDNSGYICQRIGSDT